MSNPLPKVRILDTPGLADTRSIQQDELYTRNIATQVEQYSHSITGILILANGTVPRVTLGSTLSAISSRTPSGNFAFLLTNVLSLLHQNLILPPVLKDAPQFLLDNPIPLQRKYLKLKNDPNMKRGGAYLRNVVKASERNALKMLVRLFDWLDGLEPARDDGDCTEVLDE
jgi:hypothetical protein